MRDTDKKVDISNQNKLGGPRARGPPASGIVMARGRGPPAKGVPPPRAPNGFGLP
jgi:hypothetical protein